MSKTKKIDKKPDDQSAYMVLARKYRPSNFDELIGQGAMVRTLSNAFKLRRVAQGFMLTGVRGVGKTTTARILARALNYQPEGSNKDASNPTIDMPLLGVHCQAIMESRHVDVLEMDAASHTGVDDIREIIESTRYKPISARYKVYIIDEVHMLSKSAFNALLKTLEEPPEHVKFIFATTEVQKVPVTVLSRCQRFDLKRVDVDELIKLFAGISAKEGAGIDEDALGLIAQAAQGSVRDGLSILDQAIAQEKQPVSGDDVRLLLGLADRTRIFDLLTSVLKGDAPEALLQCDNLFMDGAEPARILIDLAETVHILTRKKIVDDRGSQALSEGERSRVEQMGGQLSLPVLSRCWQMLIKGLDECNKAPDQLAAVEMVLIRISYAADLPSPTELARVFERRAVDEGAAAPGENISALPSGGKIQPIDSPGETSTKNGGEPRQAVASVPTVLPRQQLKKQNQAFLDEVGDPISSFEDIAELVGREGGLVLKIAFEENVRPISFAPGAIEIALLEEAPQGLANDIKRLLNNSSGENWIVAVGDQQGGETIYEQKKRQRQSELEAVKKHPLVKAALKQFPDARISDIRDLVKRCAEPKNDKEENE